MCTIRRLSTDLTASHWYLDSGASEYFSFHRHLFETFKELNQPYEITTAEGTAMLSESAIGDIFLSAVINWRHPQTPSSQQCHLCTKDRCQSLVSQSLYTIEDMRFQ